MTTNEAIEILQELRDNRIEAAKREDWYSPDKIEQALDIVLTALKT